MSRAVRRLVLDYQPLWVLMDLVLLALLVFMNWGWLFNVRSTSVVQWFVPVFSIFSGLLFAPKLPAWQALPISAGDRRRAMWWLWIGLPLIRAVLCMILPLAVLTPLKGVHATPEGIVSVMEMQLLAVIPMGAIFSGHGLIRRRFGVASGMVLVVPLFMVGALFSPLELSGSGALAGGAIAVVALAVGSYVLTDWFGAATARLFDPREGPAAAGTSATRHGARGWAALLPYAFSAIVLAVAVAVAINYSMVAMLGPGLAEHARRTLPGQMLMTVILLSAIGGQAAPYALRALRALPLGPEALTAVLQGFMLAVTLLPAGVMWWVLSATGFDTSKLPILLFGMLPIVALRLPVNFRVGVQVGMFVTMVPMIGLLFLPFAPWTSSPWFDAAMVLAAALVWLWTWWEMACGRAAYRVLPLGLARWRGGLN
jgi:hypothetical protein